MTNKPTLNSAAKYLSGLALCILFLGIGGCTHYRLGQPGELPFKTVYVPPVENRSMAPQVQALLTQQIIAQLQEQQAIKISSSPSADATLEVVVFDYERSVAATQSSDTYLGQSFNLTLEASVSLRNNRDGTDYFKERNVSATQQAFVTGGFLPSEYEAMPPLTEKLALKIVNMTTSVW